MGLADATARAKKALTLVDDGHDPAAGDDFFVRYEEQQAGTKGNGSLVAPFEGEHGWYWLNINEVPVTITLTVTGFFDDIVDYGIF